MDRFSRRTIVMNVMIIFLILGGCQRTEPESSHQSSSSIASANIEPLSSIAKGEEITAPIVDWNQPSDGDYPKLAKGERLWIDVSISKQRVYIKDADKTLYTMVTSSGLDTSSDTFTPRGTYYIQPERGAWFYNKKEQEGAKFFVSWKNHGEFLFHSVAMDKNGSVIEKEAEKLGQKASHGCFRLTVPDAKWIYDHIPEKTKVVIHE